MIKYVVVLLLLSTTVLAQTYPVSPQRDSIQAACLSALGLGVAGNTLIPVATVQKAINRSISQVCLDFPAIEKMDTLTTGSDEEGAALPDDFLRVRALFKMKGDTLRIPIEYKPLDSLLRLTPTDLMATHKIGEAMSPSYYYTFGQRLLFHPKYAIPSATSDSFLLMYYAMDDQLGSDTEVTLILPEYLDAIVFYACAQLSIRRGNMADADFFYNSYNAMLRERKPREAELKK